MTEEQSSYLDNIEKIAKGLIEEESNRILNGGEHLSSFWFLSGKKLYGFTGCPCSAPIGISSAKALSFMTHLMTLASSSSIVFHVLETYMSEFCGYCGGELSENIKCPKCGKEEMMAKNNIFSKEIIMLSAKIAATDGSLVWIREIHRDEGGKVTKFTESSSSGTWLPIEPIVGNYWEIEKWMAPHFIYNYAPIIDAIGNNTKNNFKEIIIEETSNLNPEEFIVVDKGFLESVNKKVKELSKTKENTNG